MRRLRASFKRSCVFSGERSRRVPAHGLKLSRTPEPILQLQRQLEDFSEQPARAGEVTGFTLAGRSRLGNTASRRSRILYGWTICV